MDFTSPSETLHPPPARSRRPISPSRQSVRRPRSLVGNDIYSLLANLSPSFILNALLAPSPISHSDLPSASHPHGQDSKEFVRDAVAHATSSDRVWGVRAAQFAKSVGEWLDELDGWAWSAGNDGKENPFLTREGDDEIREYERRASSIQAELSKLGINELKDYVRDAHSYEHSSQWSLADTKYELLDDFTALITATIVQALPRLARLNALLASWSLRLMVLKRVPAFLKSLNDCEESMLSAQIAIQTPTTPNTKLKSGFSEHVFAEMKAVVQDQVSHLAQQVDTMLDLLEGSKDTLPDSWIDSMDRLENEYSSWVVEAQQRVLNNEFDAQQARTKVDPTYEDDSKDAIDQALIPKPAMSDVRVPGHDERGSLSEPAHSAAFETQKVPADREQHEVDRSRTEQPKESNASDKALSTDGESIDSVDPESINAESCSATSEASSIISNPQIEEAETATYLGSPTIVSTPMSTRFPSTIFTTPTKPSNQDFNTPGLRKSWHGLPSGGSHIGHQRKRSRTLTDEPFDVPGLDSIQPGASASRFPPTVPRPSSASFKSFEIVPREEIRTIVVRRRESASSQATGTPPGKDTAKEKTDLISSKNLMQTPDPSPSKLARIGQDSAGNDSSTVSLESPFKIAQHKAEKLARKEKQTVPDQFNGDSRSPPGSQAEGNAQHRADRKIDKINITPTKYGRSESTDRLEERISHILNNIPVDIRLTSAAENGTATAKTSMGIPKAHHSRRISLPRIMRSKTPAPAAATLTPAPTTGVGGLKAKGSSETKLYHLHQSGKDAPIKLYIRLVGEAGDRVMVRIGGGWADLSEYLKEYANHHGKRAISDGKFNIHGVTASSTSSPANSSMASPSSRPSSPSQGAHPKKARQMTTPEGFSSPPQTPPDPQSSDVDSPSPSMGLAGPRTRDVNISPRKQAWVEGMLRQARRASGGGVSRKEKGASEQDKFGDLGSVGGVRRVFLRNRKESL